MSEPMLCWRFTTDTGSIIELWEYDAGFELLFAESHHRDDVLHAINVTLLECELLAEKLQMSTGAVRDELAAVPVDGETE